MYKVFDSPPPITSQPINNQPKELRQFTLHSQAKKFKTLINVVK